MSSSVYRKERIVKQYILKRLLIIVPTIVLIAVMVFTLLYFTPGDPAEMILGSEATEEELASYREYLGIDRPYLVQLGEYLYNLFIKFDLGKSWVLKTDISSDIMARMPRTFVISMYSMLVGALCGIPMGVLAATRQGGLADKIVLFCSSVMHCIPNYVIALLLIIVFSLHLGWLPAYGSSSWRHYILPCATILIGSFSGLSRSMRTSMLEVIRSDYVMAAKAQGFSRRSVYYVHALPNAMIPIITQLGGQFATALSGTIILETIFSIPGMGLYMQSAITVRDRPIIISTVVVLAIWFCLVMLAVDIVYALIDPRIKAQYEAQQGSGRRRRHGRKARKG